MRIFIADDLPDLHPQWANVLADMPLASPLPGKNKAALEAAAVLFSTSDPKEQSTALDLRDQPEQLSAILDAVGIAMLNRGYVPEGRKFIEQALAIRYAFFGKRHPAIAASLTSLARVYRMEGELIRGLKAIDQAMAINRKFHGGGGLPLVTSYVEAGVLHLYDGNAVAAERMALRGLSLLKRHGLQSVDPNASRLYDTLGRALESRGRLTSSRLKARVLFRAAVRALSAAVRLDRKQVGQNHPKYVTHLANLACAQWAQGDLVAAEAGFREVIRVYETLLKRPLHPNLIDAYANLGSVLVQKADPDAQHILKEALSRNEASRGPDHTLVGNDHANLGRYYFSVQDTKSARQEFDKALAIYLRNVKARRLSPRHPYIAEARDWLSRCP